MSKIPFAYSVHKKKLVSINDVPGGLECNCICPSCEMQLKARKGDVECSLKTRQFQIQ